MPRRGVWGYDAEARAAERSCDGRGGPHPALAALAADRLGVCFSGAGFGAAYQLGAAQVLQALGILDEGTPLSGASAGSIVAASVRCGVAPLDVLGALTAVSQDLLSHGQMRRLAGALRPHLERLLPDTAHEACSSSVSAAADSAAAAKGAAAGPRYHTTPPPARPDKRAERTGTAGERPPAGPSAGHEPQRARLVAPPGAGRPQPAVPSQQQQQQAAPFVVAATRVTGCCPVCWRPDVFDGGYASKEELISALLASAHEPLVSDGSLAARFRRHHYADAGLRDPCPPIPGASFTLIVYPVAAALLGRPWPYRAYMHPPPPQAVAISPGLHGRAWPLSSDYKGSNKLVMHPQPPEVLAMLFERGRRDALAWAQQAAHLDAAGLASVLAHRRQLQASGSATGSSAQRQAVDGGGPADAGAGADLAAAAALLGMRPADLPMLLPVPHHLLHFL